MTLLRNALLVDWNPTRVDKGDLRVDGERIAGRAAALSPAPGEEKIDLGGRVVTPGFVCAHHHLYSALARGMPPASPPPADFREILEKVWWRLDRALDAGAVRTSALVGAVDAALSGTTLIFDHHASPSAIGGSLDLVAGALQEVGLRGVLAYEVTDRNGAAGANAGLEENRRFARAAKGPCVRAMIGAHASFTLEDGTLRALGELAKETGLGVHLHVGEDPCDAPDPVARLRAAGVLGPKTLAAHAIHVDARALGCWVAHNPRSNANNRVGRAKVEGARAVLGTDGIDGDMLAELKFAALARTAGIDAFAAGYKLAQEAFGLPFGKLEAGAPADLAVLDYVPPTPMTAENVAGHVAFGWSSRHVRDVMVGGRWVVRDRKPVKIDADALFGRARDEARRLWERM